MVRLPVEILEIIISYIGNVDLYTTLFGKKIPHSILQKIENTKLSNALQNIRYCRDIFGENNVNFCAKLYSKLFNLQEWEKCFHVYLLSFYNFSDSEKKEFARLTSTIITKLGQDLAMHIRFYISNDPSLYLYFLEKSDLMKFIMYMNLSRYNDGLSFLLFSSNLWVLDGKIATLSYMTFDHLLDHFYENMHVEKVNHDYYTLINDFLREMYMQYLCDCDKCKKYKQTFRKNMRSQCMYMQYFV